MKVAISINTKNSAFADHPNGTSGEVSRILLALAKRIEKHPHFSPGHSQPLFDVDNNEVGFVSVYDSWTEIKIVKPKRSKKAEITHPYTCGNPACRMPITTYQYRKGQGLCPDCIRHSD